MRGEGRNKKGPKVPACHNYNIAYIPFHVKYLTKLFFSLVSPVVPSHFFQIRFALAFFAMVGAARMIWFKEFAANGAFLDFHLVTPFHKDLLNISDNLKDSSKSKMR